MTLALSDMKIALVATSSSSRDLAPYNDLSWKIWSIGYNAGVIPRGDKWFEMHRDDVLDEVGIHPDVFKNMQELKSDLIAHEKNKHFPDATLYPFDLVFANFRRKYFTSSVAWMMALAILANPSEIALYGIDMCDTDEYSEQRPCCEYWVGMAEGRGIKVTIHKNSPICRAERMYGYDNQNLSREIVMRRAARKDNLETTEKIKNEAAAVLKKAEEEWHYSRGRKAELESIAMRWR